MHTSGECVVCHGHVETVLHCLRDCMQARRIWQRMGFNVAGAPFMVFDLREWLRELLQDSNPLAVATIWWLWRARNLWCIEGRAMTDQMLKWNIAAMADDISRFFATAVDMTPAPPRVVKWTVELADCVVLNVDGSVRGDPLRGGFGGCFRTSHGQWMSGFYGFLNDTCILHLELLGIFHGLSTAWERGHRLVECQSDSLDAVSLVTSSVSPYHLYAALIWDIKDLLNRDWVVKIRHILREGNACADLLAKHGAGQSAALVWLEQPLEGLGVLLMADAWGVSFLRP